MKRALCVGRPPEWWDPADDAARLALLICSVCPERTRCAATAGRPAGVIRGGVAYGDDGEVLRLCPCGRPVATARRERTVCFTCVPSQATFIPGLLRVKQRRGKADSFIDLIGEWRAEGLSFREIGFRLRMRKDTVRDAWNRSQAVSTGGGAA